MTIKKEIQSYFRDYSTLDWGHQTKRAYAYSTFGDSSDNGGTSSFQNNGYSIQKVKERSLFNMRNGEGKLNKIVPMLNDGITPELICTELSIGQKTFNKFIVNFTKLCDEKELETPDCVKGVIKEYKIVDVNSIKLSQALEKMQKTKISNETQFIVDNVKASLFAEIRWDKGIFCPKCNHDKYYALSLINGKKEQTYVCANSICRSRFHCYSHTIFEGTKLSIDYWIDAIKFYICYNLSSHQTAAVLGITQKTAYWMLEKIKYLLSVLEVELSHDDIEAKKLTALKVREIRLKLSETRVTLSDLAKNYSVSPSTILEIRDNKIWKNL